MALSAAATDQLAALSRALIDPALDDASKAALHALAAEIVRDDLA